ncbi:MAG: methylmalonyl-CoA mutase family protein [Thermodesulfobacteriota bacterium]|nr:methylmalonyl-CoA mutase family protein [Thermodesulfobacteriota bacterium]
MQHKESEGKFETGSGIPVKVAYTPDDVRDLDYERDLALPGVPPYTRGVYPTMYRGRLWTIRRYSGYGTPEETNELYRHEYREGQTGFSIAFDTPTNSGLDSDDPRVGADVGIGGVPVCSLDDMEILFEGLPIEKVATSVTGKAFSHVQQAMYFAMAEKRGLELKELRGTTQADILTALGCMNYIDQIAPRHAIRLLADLVEWSSEVAPRWHPVSFDTYNARENGVNAYQELAILMADAIAYIEEERKRGRIPLEQYIRGFSFNMGSHNDFLEEIAKFRAARRMWYRLVKDRYGIDDARCHILRLHVQSSGITHTTQQPLNNLMRIAFQVLAAVLGGAQSVHANGYDEGLCLPTEQSMLLSIRTEQIVQHETNVINTADPLGGSYYLEWLTNELETRAWQYLKRIEEAGGLVEALESGWLQGEFRKAIIEHQKRLETVEVKVVGVNCFEMEEEPYQVRLFRPNPRAAEIQTEKLQKLRRKRDNQKVEEALRELREVTKQGENVMPAVMKGVGAYATMGEICNVWRDIYGTWSTPIGL